MPGGGSTIGTNYFYNSTKPNGLSIHVSSTSTRNADVYNSEACKYDMSKMRTVFGVPGGRITYLAPGIVDRPEDIMQAQGIKFGHTAGGVALTFIFAKELIGFPVDKVILAYTGSGPARAAFFGGEINACGDSIAGYLGTGTVQRAGTELMPFIQSGIHDAAGNLIRDPAAPDVMTGKELYEIVVGGEPSGMAWKAYNLTVALGSSYDKLIHLHPDTPDNIVQAYVDACEKMWDDPAFFDVMSTMYGEAMVVLIGDECEKPFRELLMSVDDELTNWVSDTLANNYQVTVFD
jgi:hypothetical protein